MKQTWVIVADAAHARVFELTAPDNRLREIDKLSHPESQMYAHELRTGGKGDVIDSAGFGHHQPDPHTNTSEKHAAFFAKELAEFLRKKRTDDAFGRLVIVAEPQLLGLLRDKLDQRTAEFITDSIDKDWVQHDTRQIEQFLSDKL